MYEIAVELTGIAPMAQSRLTEEDLELIDKGSNAAKKPQKDKVDQAVERMYYRGDGYIGVPKRNLKACLMEGSKKASLKYGRQALWPFIKATVYVREDMPSLGIKKPDAIERFAVQRKDGNQVVVVRGLVNDGWKLAFTFIVVDDRRDSEQLKIAMEEGGMLVGLCAGRPDYGRFEVTKWDVIKEGKGSKKHSRA